MFKFNFVPFVYMSKITLYQLPYHIWIFNVLIISQSTSLYWLENRFKVIFDISSALSFHSQFNVMLSAWKNPRCLVWTLSVHIRQAWVGGKRRRINSCPQICTDPFHHHFGNFFSCIQDEGVAEPLFAQS